MCSIFGVAFQDGCTLEDFNQFASFLKRLTIECQSRGRDSTGLAFISPSNISVIKKWMPADNFVNLPEYTKAVEDYGNIFCGTQYHKPVSILGHCRAQTQGSKFHNVNNHPIIRKNVVGVHNGIIHNDHTLFAKHENEFLRNGEVDSEIIFALIEHFAKTSDIGLAIQKASDILRGSMACAMVHTHQPYLLWLFRDNNPCTIYHFIDTGVIVWASMEQQIVNALCGVDFGRIEIIPFSQNRCICIDLYRNKTRTFII